MTDVTGILADRHAEGCSFVLPRISYFCLEVHSALH